MKKEYLEAPDYEIIMFETEDIMSDSSIGGNDFYPNRLPVDEDGWITITVKP